MVSKRRILGSLNEWTEIEWKVPNLFTLSFDDTDFYESPSFIFANTSWNLCIYPSTSPNRLFLYLLNENRGSYSDGSYSLTIKRTDGTLFGSATLDGISACSIIMCDILGGTGTALPSSSGDSMVIALTLKLGAERKPPVISRLTIGYMVCNAKERRCSREIPVVCMQTVRSMKRMDLHTLSKDFENFYKDKESCDTTLYVKNKVFTAHRIVLRTRSPVFAAMFEHDTLEKQTGLVNISDCDPASFEQFLKYLYTGHVDDIPFASAFHLYYISDKYDVQTLKTFCADYLMQCFTVENVCDIISFADMSNDTNLMSAARYYYNHHKEKSSNLEFKEFFRKNLSLGNSNK